MSKVIIGIDPSSRKLACVVTWDANLYKHVLLLPPKKEAISCNMAYNYIATMIKAYRNNGHDVYVFIEMAVGAPGGGYGSLIPQAEISGAVHAACGAHGVPIMKVQNSKWKKAIVGKGNAKKPEIASWVNQYWHQAYELANGDQDVIDAACINRWGAKNQKMVVVPRPKPRRVTPTVRKVARKKVH